MFSSVTQGEGFDLTAQIKTRFVAATLRVLGSQSMWLFRK